MGRVLLLERVLSREAEMDCARDQITCPLFHQSVRCLPGPVSRRSFSNGRWPVPPHQRARCEGPNAIGVLCTQFRHAENVRSGMVIRLLRSDQVLVLPQKPARQIPGLAYVSRIGFEGLCPVSLLSTNLARRDTNINSCSVRRFRFHVQVSANQPQPFAHADQSQAAFSLRRFQAESRALI